MTLERAHVIKAVTDSPETPPPNVEAGDRARRIAREVLDARADAARIVADARQQAEAVIASAAEAAAAEARAKEVARLAAGFLALRDAEARRAEQEVDRLIELAVLLAERLVGEAIRVEPVRIAELAAAAIHEARGARRVRIDAAPDDVAALGGTVEDALVSLARTSSDSEGSLASSRGETLDLGAGAGDLVD
ncbi:MAG TPA: hypothetical protein VM925_34055, partial [Labilithrix sp.]|nr:hypothetical protein [Labilithrix sp.]